MFKKIRVAVLLFILASVAINAYRTHNKLQGWRDTLQVAVFPINADGSEASDRQIIALNDDSFAPVEQYLNDQAKRHAPSLSHPVRVSLGNVIKERPPAVPLHPSTMSAIRWSLAMRYWAWRNTPATAIHPDVRVFLLYHDPAQTDRLQDSTGLAKGQISLANVFANRTMHGSNLVVLTHETLHALGATDKYDRATNQPSLPDGFAQPDKKPLYPQTRAEIMGGRIPISPDTAITPPRLADTVIGEATAREIGWIKAK